MSDIASLLLRAAFTYIYLLALVRLSGKRTVAQGTPFDFVVALVVGDMPDDMIFGDIPLIQGVVAMGTLFALHLLVALRAYHSRAVDQLVNAPSELAIEGGQPRRPALARERISDMELMGMLRQHQIEELAVVEKGWLEPSGKLAVLKREQRKEAVKGDVGR
jgi:uncharacterized membrane protein YcaP (DUF421 family)